MGRPSLLHCISLSPCVTCLNNCVWELVSGKKKSFKQVDGLLNFTVMRKFLVTGKPLQASGTQRQE